MFSEDRVPGRTNAEQAARRLHLVDLNGAFAEPRTSPIKAIVKALGMRFRSSSGGTAPGHYRELSR